MEYKWFMLMTGYFGKDADNLYTRPMKGLIQGYYSSHEEASSHIEFMPDELGDGTFRYRFIDYDFSCPVDWYEIINLKDGVCE